MNNVPDKNPGGGESRAWTVFLILPQIATDATPVTDGRRAVAGKPATTNKTFGSSERQTEV